VFVADEYGFVFVDRRIRYAYGSEEAWERGKAIDVDITHWMSIDYPAPPKRGEV
jgi:hypothetical protein